jgi:hypothetical protein
MLQFAMGGDEYWNSDREFVLDADTMTLADVFKIHLVAGHFPLFPYAAYPMVGLIIGRVLFSDRSPSKEPH